MDESRRRTRLLKRRALLQMGVGSVAALGAGRLEIAASSAQVPGSGQGGGNGQGPGSGQGQQAPRPPAPEAVVNVAAHASRGLDRAVDLAAVRLAESAAGAQRRRQPAPAAGELAGQPLHAALQLQRLESRADDPHARRRAPARDAQKSSRPQPQSRAEGARARPVRSASRRARRRRSAACRRPRASRATRRRTRRTIFGHFHEFFEGSPIELVDTNCLSGHVNVPHGSHTTNLHTHGLHVEPGMNRERHARRTTAFCACCRMPMARSRKSSAVRGCRGARAARARRRGATTNIRSATCSGPRGGRVRRRSRIRRARIGITRTPMGPRTIRSPAASPASSSSKATWTMRSTGR